MKILNPYDSYNVTLFRKGSDNGYICSICGQVTDLNDSTSSQGISLICMRCVYKISHLLDITAGEVTIKLHKKGEITRKEYEDGETKLRN